jgi:hypothetical protein
MPGKGRRVASRQAQLGRRRRRQTKGPAESSVAAPATAVADAEPVVGTTAPAEAVPQQEPEPSRETRVRPMPSPRAPRSSAASRSERPAAYNYVGTELRRILIVSGALFAVLVALAFVI